MNRKYETNVAQSVSKGHYFEAMDVFACGQGLYAIMCPAGSYESEQENAVLIMEVINLGGVKLKPLLEGYSHIQLDNILEDYCFLAYQDLLVSSKFEKRRKEKRTNPYGLALMDYKKDARTLEEIEMTLGCLILNHFQAKENFFVHKWGVIEYE